MACPPWWRVKCDGYGGQGSMGGESAEGAVGVLLQERNPLRKETETDREPQHVAEVAGEKAVR